MSISLGEPRSQFFYVDFLVIHLFVTLISIFLLIIFFGNCFYNFFVPVKVNQPSISDSNFKRTVSQVMDIFRHLVRLLYICIHGTHQP